MPGQALPAVKLLAKQMLAQAQDLPAGIIVLQDAEVSSARGPAVSQAGIAR